MRLSTDCAESGVAHSVNAASLNRMLRMVILQRSNEGTEKIATGRALATERVASTAMARVPAQQFPNLTVLSHPLSQHKLNIIRDNRIFFFFKQKTAYEIAMLMAYEVTKDLPLEPVE